MAVQVKDTFRKPRAAGAMLFQMCGTAVLSSSGSVTQKQKPITLYHPRLKTSYASIHNASFEVLTAVLVKIQNSTKVRRVH
jgi:hypothetical protein